MKAIVQGVHALARWMEQPGVTLNVLSITFGLIGVIASVLGVFMMVEANQKMDIAAFAQFTTSQQMVAIALHDIAADTPSRGGFAAMSESAQAGVLERTTRHLTAQFGNVALRNSPNCRAAWNDLFGFTYVHLNGLAQTTPQKLGDSYFIKHEALFKECEDFLK